MEPDQQAPPAPPADPVSVGELSLPGVVRSGAAVLGIIGVGLLLQYGIQIGLARLLGRAGFGRYSLLFAVVALVALPAGLGLRGAAIRFLPHYLHQGRTGLARGFVIRGHQLVIAGGVVTWAVIVAVVALSAGGEPAADYAVALSAVPALGWVMFDQHALRAAGHPIDGFATFWLVRPLAVGGSLLAVLLVLGADVGPRAALAATTAGLVMTAVVQTATLRRRVRPGPAPELDTRAWLQVGLPLVVVSTSQEVIGRGGLLVLGAFDHPSDVAPYAAAVRTSLLVSMCFIAVQAAAGPRMARLRAAGDEHGLQLLVRRAIGVAAIPTAVGAVVIILAGRPILRLFGPGFEDGYGALVVLAIGTFVASIVGPVSELLVIAGQQRVVAKVYVVSAVTTVGLALALVPAFGATGAGVATAVAVAGENVWQWALVERLTGVRLLRPRREGVDRPAGS